MTYNVYLFIKSIFDSDTNLFNDSYMITPINPPIKLWIKSVVDDTPITSIYWIISKNNDSNIIKQMDFNISFCQPFLYI